MSARPRVHCSWCEGCIFYVSTLSLPDMDALTTEMNEKFELIDTNSNKTLAHSAPQTHEVNATSDPMQIDSNIYQAGFH